MILRATLVFWAMAALPLAAGSYTADTPAKAAEQSDHSGRVLAPATRCRAPEYRPPITTTVARRVMVRPETVEWRVIPAIYETKRHRRLVKPAQTRQVYVPPLYEYRDMTVSELNKVRGRVTSDALFDKFGQPLTKRVKFLLRPGHYRLQHEAAIYAEEIVTVKLREETQVRHVIPAVWRTIHEVREIAPGSVSHACN